MENLKKLRLGLDIGTNSVGYALLDENNKLIRKNGHTFWGVRMFEEASDASSRRSYRSNRRRLSRRKQRLMELKEIFCDEISKIDKNFFIRTEDSFFKIEDKRLKNSSNLFDDKNYTDYDYYHDYPTIYHLRKYLLETTDKVDIRFIYLAVAHILKYRGNFLMPGDEFIQSDYAQIKDAFTDINATLVEMSNNFEEYEDNIDDYFAQIDTTGCFYEKLKEILVNVKGISNKKKELTNLFNTPKKSLANELIIPLLSGSKINLSNLSIIKNEKHEKIDVTLDDENLEEVQNNACEEIGIMALIFSKITEFKRISDFYFVIKILNSKESISSAMVDIYNDHQKDLKELKQFFKKYSKEAYSAVFRIDKNDSNKNNYPHYIGYDKVSVNSRNKVAKRFAHCSRVDFYNFLKKKLLEIKDEDAQNEISKFINKMDDDSFLLKQKSNKNGALPMQLHLAELKKILKNQANNYSFLNEKDESGITNIDKIIAIFKFKVPYYVGPLNKKSDFAWVERTDERIKPWNFDKVVDVDSTAAKFIERMQNKCSYLKGDNDFCLPKSSIVFSEYNCLSYLNKLMINGSYLSVQDKEKIFNEVFLVKKQPTRKDLANYFQANYNANVLTTTAKEIPEVNCNMASYCDMKRIFGNSFSKYKDEIENIIKDITVFEDKTVLERRLHKYGLPNEIIKQLKGLNYSKYANLCMKLLNGLVITNPNTGEIQGTVLEIMRKTNLNLQEILYLKDYRLIDAINEYNEEFISDNKKMDIKEYLDEFVTISPLYKRPLIQSYHIIEEIETIFNRPIDEYYIECTRTNKAEKKASVSRYDNLKRLYNACKGNTQLINEKIDFDELNKSLDENKNALKSDLLFLYFTQLGRCMYSLEPIDIEELKDNSKYDIDHIYPQSLIKDDSITNRVLVKKTLNNSKSDKFLYEANVLNPKAYAFYKKLYESNLISKEKYTRLTEKEIPSSKLDKFVNRQIVSTNQAVKSLIQTLKEYHNVKDTNIIYSKAENVSAFRHKFDLVKSRTANNFHHAHDAYLNVIVGGALNKYFNYRHFNEYKDVARIKNNGDTLNVDKIFEKEVVINGNVVIWNKNELIKRIKHDMYERFDISETIRTYNSNIMIPKVTILPASNDQLIGVKSTTKVADTTKYGGLKSNSFSKYVLLETLNKGKVTSILEAIPKMKENNIDEYLQAIGYSDYKVMCNNVKINATLIQEKKKYVITGKSGNFYVVKNLNDRFFSYNDMTTIKKIDKYLDFISKNEHVVENENMIIVSKAKEENNDVILTEEEIDNLINRILQMYATATYNYGNIVSLIDTIENNFQSLKLSTKIEVINELLKLLKTNERKLADLTKIGLSKQSGVLQINKKLSKGTKIILESYTGYYKKVLYEVK